MKNNTFLLIIAGVLIVVIFFSILTASVNVLPYSDTKGNGFPYEGFHNLEYSTNTGHMATDSYNSFLINKDSNQCKKAFGFDGLFCEPYVADKQIDVLANTPGKLTCNGEGSGLSNSMGSLCFTPEQKQLLTTRGGNATGTSTEIGK
jgi:hypothetical protein